MNRPGGARGAAHGPARGRWAVRPGRGVGGAAAQRGAPRGRGRLARRRPVGRAVLKAQARGRPHHDLGLSRAIGRAARGRAHVEGQGARAPSPRERSRGAFYPVSVRTLPYKAQTAQEQSSSPAATAVVARPPNGSTPCHGLRRDEHDALKQCLFLVPCIVRLPDDVRCHLHGLSLLARSKVPLDVFPPDVPDGGLRVVRVDAE